MKKYLKNPIMTWTLEKYPELKIEARNNKDQKPNSIGDYKNGPPFGFSHIHVSGV